MYAVAPGFVETDMATSLLSGPEGDAIRAQSPLNRVARPEEVARVVVFLAAEGSDYLTGSIIDVNGASYLRS
jgi:3-oxoacyl-[acyl-carrier protein] reductase